MEKINRVEYLAEKINELKSKQSIELILSDDSILKIGSIDCWNTQKKSGWTHACAEMKVWDDPKKMAFDIIRMINSSWYLQINWEKSFRD